MTTTAMIATTPRAISGPEISISASFWLLLCPPGGSCRGPHRLDVEAQPVDTCHPYAFPGCDACGRGRGPGLGVHGDHTGRIQVGLCDALGPHEMIGGKLGGCSL